MKKLNVEELVLINGGDTPSPRDCYVAGIGVVMTASVLGVLTGWFQKNLDTFRSCFE